LANIEVQLFKDGDGNNGLAPIQTALTNAQGEYVFDDNGKGLKFGPEIQYQVGFIAPSKYLITKMKQGSDITKDSDASPESGKTVFMTPTESVGNIDCGLYEVVGISGLVWLDENDNGIQDANETTFIPNVLVTLKLQSGGGFVNVSSTKTSATGKYAFENLAPGTYRVEFNKNGLTVSYIWAKPNQGTDRTKDSDAIPDGVNTVDTATTAAVTIAVGTSTVLDAGLVKPAATPTPTPSAGPTATPRPTSSSGSNGNSGGSSGDTVIRTPEDFEENLTPPKTGDDTQAMIGIIVLALAAIGLVLAGFAGKKKRKAPETPKDPPMHS
jgi:LPXTG-motif cell wall-anchored protein